MKGTAKVGKGAINTGEEVLGQVNTVILQAYHSYNLDTLEDLLFSKVLFVT